ncbi:lysostaphin resistance A-like protein [Nonomuraea sp. NPDC050556]|uniref:lysostaphin resistance A-like protein n=1 Tax=Nonomuraea sp. NPDC050556 TaxID=3364369 RepID=UPI00378D69F9
MRKILGIGGVFFLVALLASGALNAVQPLTGVPAEVIQLTQFGPALGVAAVAILWPAAVRSALAGALGAVRGAGGPALVALALLVVALCATAYGVITGDPHFTSPADLGHPVALVLVAQLAGACGEEVGWRCLLQPLLRTRFGPLASSVVTGLLWGAWHVPVFGRGPVYAGGFLLAAVSLSVVLGLALDRVRSGRLLLAGGFHTVINIGLLLFMDEESGAAVPMVAFGAASLAVALMVRLQGARNAKVS